MTSFAEARTSFTKFIEEVFAALDLEKPDEITLPYPNGPIDELHFRKFVAWTYVAIIEVHPIPIRRVGELVRASSSTSHKQFSSLKQVVHALRTLQSHNVPRDSTQNEKTHTIAEAWLLEHAGDPTCWRTACEELCSQVKAVFDMFLVYLKVALSTDDDPNCFVNDLRDSLLGRWEHHCFDEIVREECALAGLYNIDEVAFRRPRIEQWIATANLFNERESGISAVRRAIRAEVALQFGPRSTQ